MTLEQRVEALEKTVKVLAGRDFAVDEGRVFINEAFIQEGATKAAQNQAAFDSNVNAALDNAKQNLISNTRQFQS
ncbi:hypothetical protein ABL26_003423 [Salmonella enterica subsp. enterica serovar Oranienburg]|uniref:Uncharacterized protein n=1 Tax=Salmonella oranienberg TaxID=28147 RepID=A0A5I4QG08_SALON|nr:hypothetical protein [Salmonella enterica subsp. enterica serovar Oranienburg]EBV2922134.1 hypothetical protein [Salmonella enterica subsp. enterica serovar Oranienburg]EBY7639401.1 hypothetical protein [Salmonella enterica subsp. enterica serovar Oranienburg]ECG3956003.1 hypothetical protein [Salmonella enterica subsp. enterica serovar Oranienburg]EDR1862596.1 hypothetical protein [Salmonella enterica subsp. enterica serovar Oranienburg]